MIRRLDPFSPVHQASVLLCYGVTHAAPAEHCNTRSSPPTGSAFDHGKPLNLQPDQGAPAPRHLSRMAEVRGATSKGEGIGDRSGHSVPPAFLRRPNRLSTFWLFELVQYAISNADLRRSSTPERERARGRRLSEGKLDVPFPQCKIFLHQWDRFLFLLVGDYWRCWRVCEWSGRS